MDFGIRDFWSCFKAKLRFPSIWQSFLRLHLLKLYSMSDCLAQYDSNGLPWRRVWISLRSHGQPQLRSSCCFCFSWLDPPWCVCKDMSVLLVQLLHKTHVKWLLANPIMCQSMSFRRTVPDINWVAETQWINQLMSRWLVLMDKKQCMNIRNMKNVET